MCDAHCSSKAHGSEFTVMGTMMLTIASHAQHCAIYQCLNCMQSGMAPISLTNLRVVCFVNVVNLNSRKANIDAIASILNHCALHDGASGASRQVHTCGMNTAVCKAVPCSECNIYQSSCCTACKTQIIALKAIGIVRAQATHHEGTMKVHQ